MPSDDGRTQSAVPANDGGPEILAEITTFEGQCEARYRFNNRWDVVLTVGGISLGIGVVAAGVYEASKLASILGAIITAMISAQRAFPFGQRAQFYRALIGQASNLRTDLMGNLTTVGVAATTLKSLRLDFAQQLPRGNTSGVEKTPPSPGS
jgi:hypothetical protein